MDSGRFAHRDVYIVSRWVQIIKKYFLKNSRRKSKINFSYFFIGQRTPPLPQNVPQQGFTPSTTPAQNVSSINMQIIQQQQKNEEIANIKDETIKRVLLELSTLQTPSQLSDTMLKVAQMVGPLFFTDFENRKDTILSHSKSFTTIQKLFP